MGKLDEHEDMMSSLRSNQSASQFKENEIIEKGFYTLQPTAISEPRASSFTKKDGSPGDDYVYVTFTVVGGEWEGSEFDSVYPYVLWARLNDEGKRTKTGDFQALIEACLGRLLDADEEVDFHEDIVVPGLKCQGTVEVATSKDGKKTFNKLVSPLPMPKRRQAAQAATPARNSVDEFADALGDPEKAEAYASGRR